ncbi:MAG: cytochrome c [Sediminimonas sp.]|uniref:cytochrome c n=1 Tax=Sediminimonas sp. TaxID=2823379 RepID=UPI00286FB874|nr:cytochrome c [Sediminimonas sp.]MDR9484022.1 cytochrome c [Sediminimonas sp.]
MIRGAAGIALGLLVLVSCAQRQDPATDMAPGAISLADGETVFRVGGCASCHTTPGETSEDAPHLGGGQELQTRYGTFRVPNISPDNEHGIGTWTEAQFARAMLRGVSPEGQHYYPTFPYTSYARMSARDLANLWAYLQSLPPVRREVQDHDLRFPYNNRGAMAVWKALYFHPTKVVDLGPLSPEVARGQYLVEGPGHCGECHTPRGGLGGLDHDRWLAGGMLPEGQGFAPDITGGEAGLGGLTAEEIASMLIPGPQHFSAAEAGYEMEAVRGNLAALPEADRRAIVAYLKAVPGAR